MLYGNKLSYPREEGAVHCGWGMTLLRTPRFLSVCSPPPSQVAVENSERGLLLLRIRDEIRMTVDTHLQHYATGSKFGGNHTKDEVSVMWSENRCRAQTRTAVSVMLGGGTYTRAKVNP